MTDIVEQLTEVSVLREFMVPGLRSEHLHVTRRMYRFSRMRHCFVGYRLVRGRK